jgi:CRP-like cAMP-binding protein
MTIEDEIALLEQVPFFRRLSGGALRSLAIAAETYAMQPGEVLFMAGEAADGAYIIQQGSVALKPEVGGDENEIVAGPGTLLGETALLAQTKRPATATAREASTVLRVSRSTFLKILDSYPEAAQRLRELFVSRSDQWAREMENIRTALRGSTSPH